MVTIKWNFLWFWKSEIAPPLFIRRRAVRPRKEMASETSSTPASSPASAAPSSSSYTASGDPGRILQFDPFQSLVDEGFWHRLSSLKLDSLGLDQSPIPLTGTSSLSFFFIFFSFCFLSGFLCGSVKIILHRSISGFYIQLFGRFICSNRNCYQFLLLCWVIYLRCCSLLGQFLFTAPLPIFFLFCCCKWVNVMLHSWKIFQNNISIGRPA